MTCGLPPDSRCTTQLPNAPPGHGPLDDVAGAGAGAGADTGAGAGDCARTGAVLACRGAVATGAGGASCAGGAGIVAGSAGTRSTCPTRISSAQRIWLRLPQYSTGHAFWLWYSRPAIADSESP